MDAVGRLAFARLRRIYAAGVNPANPKAVRTASMTAVAVYAHLRCWRLLAQPALFATAAAWAAMGAVQGTAAEVGAALACLAALVAGHPSDGVGHRVGAHGFSGSLCENTVAALAALAARDAAGEFAAGAEFPFVELDVQESADGGVVVFHDATLAAAFAAFAGGANAAPLRALAAAGVDVRDAAVRELTVAQLQSLHLGGRPGLHVPTLREFMQ
jgi:hypothetical protein